MTEVYFNQTKISEKEKQLAMVVGIITCGSSPSKQKEAVFQLEAPAYSTPEGLLNLVAEEYLLLSNEFQTVNHALLPENPTIHPSANIGFPEIIDQDNPQTLNDLGYELVLRVVEKVFHQYKQDKSGTIWRQINQVCQNWQGPLAKALRLHSEVGFKAIYAGGIEYLDLFLQTIKIQFKHNQNRFIKAFEEKPVLSQEGEEFCQAVYDWIDIIQDNKGLNLTPGEIKETVIQELMDTPEAEPLKEFLKTSLNWEEKELIAQIAGHDPDTLTEQELNSLVLDYASNWSQQNGRIFDPDQQIRNYAAQLEKDFNFQPDYDKGKFAKKTAIFIITLYLGSLLGSIALPLATDAVKNIMQSNLLDKKSLDKIFEQIGSTTINTGIAPPAFIGANIASPALNLAALANGQDKIAARTCPPGFYYCTEWATEKPITIAGYNFTPDPEIGMTTFATTGEWQGNNHGFRIINPDNSLSKWIPGKDILALGLSPAPKGVYFQGRCETDAQRAVPGNQNATLTTDWGGWTGITDQSRIVTFCVAPKIDYSGNQHPDLITNWCIVDPQGAKQCLEELNRWDFQIGVNMPEDPSQPIPTPIPITPDFSNIDPQNPQASVEENFYTGNPEIQTAEGCNFRQLGPAIQMRVVLPEGVEINDLQNGSVICISSSDLNRTLAHFAVLLGGKSKEGYIDRRLLIHTDEQPHDTQEWLHLWENSPYDILPAVQQLSLVVDRPLNSLQEVQTALKETGLVIITIPFGDKPFNSSFFKPGDSVLAQQSGRKLNMFTLVDQTGSPIELMYDTNQTSAFCTQEQQDRRCFNAVTTATVVHANGGRGVTEAGDLFCGKQVLGSNNESLVAHCSPKGKTIANDTIAHLPSNAVGRAEDGWNQTLVENPADLSSVQAFADHPQPESASNNNSLTRSEILHYTAGENPEVTEDQRIACVNETLETGKPLEETPACKGVRVFNQTPEEYNQQVADLQPPNIPTPINSPGELIGAGAAGLIAATGVIAAAASSSTSNQKAGLVSTLVARHREDLQVTERLRWMGKRGKEYYPQGFLSKAFLHLIRGVKPEHQIIIKNTGQKTVKGVVGLTKETKHQSYTLLPGQGMEATTAGKRRGDKRQKLRLQAKTVNFWKKGGTGPGIKAKISGGMTDIIPFSARGKTQKAYDRGAARAQTRYKRGIPPQTTTTTTNPGFLGRLGRTVIGGYSNERRTYLGNPNRVTNSSDGRLLIRVKFKGERSTWKILNPGQTTEPMRADGSRQPASVLKGNHPSAGPDIQVFKL